MIRLMKIAVCTALLYFALILVMHRIVDNLQAQARGEPHAMEQ